MMAVDASLLQMPDAAAGAKDEPEDSDFEVDVEDDDDVPLARKKQKSARCGVSCSSTVSSTLPRAQVIPVAFSEQFIAVRSIS